MLLLTMTLPYYHLYIVYVLVCYQSDHQQAYLQGI
jgi:hypothetical protein